MEIETFEDTAAWVEADVLPAIVENYIRSCSPVIIALTTIDSAGQVLPVVVPRAIEFDDSALETKEDQEAAAEMVRECLKELAATGVLTIVFAPNQYHDDRVIVSLEHKGGRVNWIATGEDETIDHFERADGYDWESEFGFSDMLSPTYVN